MSNGSGVSRGDRNRNVRRVRLREAVPVCSAVVGIDLTNDAVELLPAFLGPSGVAVGP